MTLGEKISMLRKKEGISQEKLGQMSGVSYGSIKRFESSGQTSLLHLTRIAMALDMSMEIKELFTQVPYRNIEEVIHEGR